MLSPTLPPAVRARLSPVIRAIAEAEVAEELGRDRLDDVPMLAETATVLEHRLLGMPKHFAAGMVLLTLMFNGSTRSTDGAVFTQLSLAKRRKALARIRSLPLGPLKNFTTFYDKMAPFIFWSALEERAARKNSSVDPFRQRVSALADRADVATEYSPLSKVTA